MFMRTQRVMKFSKYELVHRLLITLLNRSQFLKQEQPLDFGHTLTLFNISIALSALSTL